MSIPSSYIQVGNPVKMIAKNPTRGMGQIKTGDVGFLKRGSYPISVDFLNHSNWQGEAFEFDVPTQQELDEYFAGIERAKAEIAKLSKNPYLLQISEQKLRFFFDFSNFTDLDEFRKAIRFSRAYWEGYEDRSLCLELEYMNPRSGRKKHAFRYKNLIPPALSNKQNKISLFTLKEE